MEIYPYFYAAWMLFWLFMFGFCLASCGAYRSYDRNYSEETILFRKPNTEKKGLLYLCLFLGSLLVMILTIFLLPEGKECFAGMGSYLDGWKRAVAVLVLLFHGMFVRLSFDLIQESKVRRNVNRFLEDCKTEGSIRAIYETTSFRHYGDFEWVLYDILHDEHDLWQITKRALSGYQYDPVFIAMNIPPEKVLQKLSQCNLLTKNGYERLPPPKTDQYLPQGGSMVQFYYQAEYVRIWG